MHALDPAVTQPENTFHAGDLPTGNLPIGNAGWHESDPHSWALALARCVAIPLSLIAVVLANRDQAVLDSGIDMH